MRWRVTAGGFVAAVLVVTGACGTSDTTAEQKPESNGTPGATVGDVEWNRVELDMDLEGIVPAGTASSRLVSPMMQARPA
jgi:hypothetical protein